MASLSAKEKELQPYGVQLPVIYFAVDSDFVIVY